MPRRLIRPARATLSGIVRAGGAIAVSALVVFSLLQANATRDLVRDSRNAQVRGCVRGNLLRAQVNRNVQVLGAFIGEAVAARRASGDARVADRYEALLPKLAPLPIVDCEHAYPAGK